MKVSIIIPYQKDRGYLQEAINSVHRQTYQDIELILSQSDKGVSYNLNRGIKKSTGDFIKYLCDDDMLTPNSITDSVNAMKGCDFIHGNAYNLFPNGNTTRHIAQPTDLKGMLEYNRIHGGTLMYRRDVFERFGYFNESLWTGEEYEFNLRLLSQGASLGVSNRFLYYYRRHEQQKSLGNKEIEYRLRRAEEIERIKNMYA